MNTKTILLTGATGFLGSHLLRFWCAKGHKLLVLKRSSSSLERIHDCTGSCQFYDVDRPGWEKAFLNHEIEAVVHLATDYGKGKLLSQIVEANVLFTLRIIELSKKHQVSVFINTDTFFNKGNLAYEHLGAYTLTKKMVEQALPFYADESFKLFNAKLEHIYGPFDNDDKFTTQMLSRLLSHEKEILLTEGTQKRDFVYVYDVVAAYDTLIGNVSQLSGFEQVPIGTGHAQSVRFFVEQLKEITHSDSELIFGGLPIRKGEFIESHADISLLSRLGWRPKYSLKAGLLDWVKNTQYP